MEYSTSIAHQAKILSEMAEDVRKKIMEEDQVLATCAAKVKLALVITTPVTDKLDTSRDDITDEEERKVLDKINEKLGEVNKILLGLEKDLTDIGVALPYKEISINDILVQAKSKHAFIEYKE